MYFLGHIRSARISVPVSHVFVFVYFYKLKFDYELSACLFVSKKTLFSDTSGRSLKLPKLDIVIREVPRE